MIVSQLTQAPSPSARPSPRTDTAPPTEAWRCTFAPNPPGAVLMIECRGDGRFTDVSVLLDGVPAADHPTVYVAADVPNVLTAGATLDYLFVLEAGRPLFDMVELQWTDEHGRRHAAVDGVENQTVALGHHERED